MIDNRLGDLSATALVQDSSAGTNAVVTSVAVVLARTAGNVDAIVVLVVASSFGRLVSIENPTPFVSSKSLASCRYFAVIAVIAASTTLPFLP